MYTAGDKGAVVFCIHGGGYTSLTWSLVAQQLKDRCGAPFAACCAALCWRAAQLAALDTPLHARR